MSATPSASSLRLRRSYTDNLAFSGRPAALRKSRLVGNTDEAEQLVHAFTPLSELARRSGDRPDARFDGMTNLQKMDLVIWARFGEDEEFDAEHWGNEDRERVRQEDLMKYEVVWRGYSPHTDGWEAILVEQDTTETLIWRKWQQEEAEVQEVSLPKGICGKVATLACQWFDPFRDSVSL